MLQAGTRYDKLPGEWHAPSTAALILRDLAEMHCIDYGGEITGFVTQGDTIYISEIEKHCSDIQDTDELSLLLGEENDKEGDKEGDYDDSVVALTQSSVKIKKQQRKRVMTTEEMRQMVEREREKEREKEREEDPLSKVMSFSHLPPIHSLPSTQSLSQSLSQSNADGERDGGLTHPVPPSDREIKGVEGLKTLLRPALSPSPKGSHTRGQVIGVEGMSVNTLSEAVYTAETEKVADLLLACDREREGPNGGSTTIRVKQHHQVERQTERVSDSDGITFFDPLHCPPPSHQRPWKHSLFLLLPLRLGVHTVNNEYVSELKAVLNDFNCVGILGGRPNQAIYFFGYNEETNTLYGHDPHTTYKAHTHNLNVRGTPLTSGTTRSGGTGTGTGKRNVSNTHESDERWYSPPSALLEEYHVREASTLPITSLDPSLAVGFYFRDREAFQAFCERWRVDEAKKEEQRKQYRLYQQQQSLRKKSGGSVHSLPPPPPLPSVSLFHILHSAPSYHYAGDIDGDVEGDGVMSMEDPLMSSMISSRSDDELSKSMSKGKSASPDGKEKIVVPKFKPEDDEADDEYVFL